VEYQYVTVPVNSDDLDEIEAIVREADIYVVQPSNISDPYSLKDFIRASAIAETSFLVLLDNNIQTRVIALANGYVINGSADHIVAYKLASAAMAYFILSGFKIEPNISIYEKASKTSHDDALEILKNFRVADHIHPQCYVDIALGRIEKIPDEEIEKAVNLVSTETKVSNNSDFTKRLNEWKYSYLFILKAVELWKTVGTDLQKAEKYIEWMANDIYFSNVSSIFSLILLAPNRMSRMVKGINSNNVQKLSEGIKNAAWDCTYIRHWLKLINNSPSDNICFLCSNDNAMKKIALSLYPKDNKTEEETLLEHFTEYWGDKDGLKLYKKYKTERDSVSKNEEVRKNNVKNRLEKVDEMIEKLEVSLGVQ